MSGVAGEIRVHDVDKIEVQKTAPVGDFFMRTIVITCESGLELKVTCIADESNNLEVIE